MYIPRSGYELVELTDRFLLFLLGHPFNPITLVDIILRSVDALSGKSSLNFNRMSRQQG